MSDTSNPTPSKSAAQEVADTLEEVTGLKIDVFDLDALGMPEPIVERGLEDAFMERTS